MERIVMDESLGAKARGLSSGLVLGQKGPGRLWLLDFLPLPAEADVELLREQVERGLVGGVEVVGVFGGEGEELRKMGWRALKNEGVEVVLGAAGPRVARVRGEETRGETSKGRLLAKMALHSTRLAVRVRVATRRGETRGAALERAAEEMGRVVRREVAVGKLNGEATELWTSRGNEGEPLTWEDEKKEGEEEEITMMVSGVISGMAFVHAETAETEGAAMVLEDLAKSLSTRVSVMLDELDVMQEEGSAPDQEHPLSRHKTVALPKNGKWALPCRRLIRGTSVPVCDWGFAWDTKCLETIARCSQIWSLEITQKDVDASREPFAEGAYLDLTGSKPAAAKKEKAAPPAAAATKNQQNDVVLKKKGNDHSNMLILFGSVFILLLAVIVWRLK